MLTVGVDSSKEEFLERVRDKKGGEIVPLLQYPDDALIFLEAIPQMVENLKVILLWFEAASSLMSVLINRRSSSWIQVRIGRTYVVFGVAVWGLYRIPISVCP